MIEAGAALLLRTQATSSPLARATGDRLFGRRKRLWLRDVDRLTFALVLRCSTHMRGSAIFTGARSGSSRCR